MKTLGVQLVSVRDVLNTDIEPVIAALRFDDAKARAETLLKKDRNDIDAMLLRATAMASLRDPVGAVAEIEEALKLEPSSSAALVTMGAVRLRGGESKQAEAAYRQAIAVDPADLNARLALANFFMATERSAEAETTLKEVIAKEPKHRLANRMLGALYVSSNRMAEAEQPLKVVVETSNTPTARFQLADYYINAGRSNDAVALLSVLAKEPATAAEAELRWATLDYLQNRTAEAHTRLDALLTRAPNYSAALVLKSRWLARENKLDDALASASAAVVAEPQSAAAHFAVAVVRERRRDFVEATKSYQETLRLNPRAVAAQVALSRLNLRAGDTSSAQKFAEEAQQSQPTSLDARVALVRSLITSGNSSRAETEIAALLKEAPELAVGHALKGMHLARVNNPKGARASYERALELSPGMFEAISGLIYLDVTGRDMASAIKRLDAELVEQPANANLFALQRAVPASPATRQTRSRHYVKPWRPTRGSPPVTPCWPCFTWNKSASTKHAPSSKASQRVILRTCQRERWWESCLPSKVNKTKQSRPMSRRQVAPRTLRSPPITWRSSTPIEASTWTSLYNSPHRQSSGCRTTPASTTPSAGFITRRTCRP